MNMKQFSPYCRVLAALLLAVLAPAAQADFERTTDATATFCSGFVVETCSPKKLLALEKDGKYFELKTRFTSVGDYRSPRNGSETGTCWIRPSFLNKFQVLFENEDGERTLDEPDSIVFGCKKLD